MHHINGISRDQISFKTLEDGITNNNPVRFIDAFSGQLDLVKLGFIINADDLILNCFSIF